MSIKKYDIIYHSIFNTDSIYSSNSMCMAKEFAKTNRVFYINKPYSLKDFIKNLNKEKVKKHAPKLLRNQVVYERLKKYRSNLLVVTPTLTLPINWLPKGRLYNTLHRYNEQAVLKTIQAIIHQFDVKNYIYINCFNPYGPATLPKEYNAALNVYQSVDDISQDEYTLRHGYDLEKQAIKKADLTLVTSRQLLALKSKLSPNTHLLPNAADHSIFKQAIEKKFPRPKELAGRKGKVIGFIGNLDHLRIDYQLIKKAALHHSDKSFLIVGPLNNTEYQTIGLQNLPNIVFTGGKNFNELPRYLQYMDCTLIPFKCNTITKSIYPLKINEYLTAGKPVVTTNFSEDIRSFADYVYLADSEKAFINLIGDALQPQSSEQVQKRIQLAASNTWTARVEQFWSIAGEYLGSNRNTSKTFQKQAAI